jgi:hypothetical protein
MNTKTHEHEHTKHQVNQPSEPPSSNRVLAEAANQLGISLVALRWTEDLASG